MSYPIPKIYGIRLQGNYVATGVFDKAQRAAIKLSPDELTELEPETRLEYTMRAEEVKAARTQAFWSAMTAALPVITFLGLEKLFR